MTKEAYLKILAQIKERNANRFATRKANAEKVEEPTEKVEKPKKSKKSSAKEEADK